MLLFNYVIENIIMQYSFGNCCCNTEIFAILLFTGYQNGDPIIGLGFEYGNKIWNEICNENSITVIKRILQWKFRLNFKTKF